MLSCCVWKCLYGNGTGVEGIHIFLVSETSDVKASIAALNYVLNSAAKYSVNSDTLANELQQLGLPKGM